MTPKQEAARDRATKTLLYYFRSAFKGAGLKWDHDCDVEVAGIVDDLFVAFTEDDMTRLKLTDKTKVVSMDETGSTTLLITGNAAGITDVVRTAKARAVELSEKGCSVWVETE